MNELFNTYRPAGSAQLIFRRYLCLGIALAAFSLSDGAQARSRSFPIPTPDSQPISIVLGPDGNLWFTEQNASKVARVTPDGVITEFQTPTFSFPIDIVPGPDGNVWFSEGSTGQIAFITPSGQITEIRFSNFDASSGITTGPDGNIWFTDLTGNNIWRCDVTTQVLTKFPIPTPSAFPHDITAGPDGNLWFTEGVGKIGRITTSGIITEFGSDLGLVYTLTDGPDGNVWFTVRFSPEIGRITPAGEITFFATPNNPEQIARGLGNTLLFTEFGANKIATITTDGLVTESQEFQNNQPTGITAGAGHRVWFLGYGNNKVYTTNLPR